MFGVLLLLVLYLSTAETATITMTEAGHSAYYLWPNSGKIRITSTCSAGLPRVELRFYRAGSDDGYITWDTNSNQLALNCRDATQSTTYDPFTPDCSLGDVTLIWQLTEDEVQVWNKGVKVAGRTRDGMCGEQPGQWKLKLFASGIVTATDEGYKLDKALYFFLQKYIY